MTLSLMDLSALLFTIGLFGWIGFSQAKRFRTPVAVATWIWLVFGVLVSRFIMLGEHAYFISIGSFHVYPNTSIQSFFAGMLVGLLVRKIRIRRQANTVA